MEIVYPEKERLLGTQTTPYVHDYLDSCAQLQRYALPVGLGNGQRYHGLGDMAKAEPGTHMFIPGEFNSLTGLRGKKTMQLPHTYHLGHKEKTTGSENISPEDLAEAEAFDDPQKSASANQTAGLERTRKVDVQSQKFELKLGTRVLRNADAQAGIYASGLRRQERHKARKMPKAVSFERGQKNIFDSLKSKEDVDSGNSLPVTRPRTTYTAY